MSDQMTKFSFSLLDEFSQTSSSLSPHFTERGIELIDGYKLSPNSIFCSDTLQSQYQHVQPLPNNERNNYNQRCSYRNDAGEIMGFYSNHASNSPNLDSVCPSINNDFYNYYTHNATIPLLTANQCITSEMEANSVEDSTPVQTIQQKNNIAAKRSHMKRKATEDNCESLLKNMELSNKILINTLASIRAVTLILKQN